MLTNKDKLFLNFAKNNSVDFVGISFVESKKHISTIRKFLNTEKISIIAKIENLEGLNNKDEIIQFADGIMIDRGDLSVETDLETLAIYQKDIIKTANKYSKPVIVATEMLHSMINNPFPTKAEVTDISNSVIDGCSATMLSRNSCWSVPRGINKKNERNFRSLIYSYESKT